MADEILAVRAGKRCPRCETLKLVSEFYRNKRDGLAPYCKLCSAAYKRKGDRSRSQIVAAVYPIDGCKRCSKCKDTKPLEEFSKGGGKKIKPHCKNCASLVFGEWLRKRKPELGPVGIPRDELRRREVQSRWNVSGGMRDCSRCSERKPVAEFVGRAYCKACRNTKEAAAYDPTSAARKRAEYRQANGDKCKAWAINGFHKRRALKISAESTLTTAEWSEIVIKFGSKCLCCGAREGLTMDHVVPLSKGGTHTADNVQPLCLSCNCSKHTKIIDYRLAA